MKFLSKGPGRPGNKVRIAINGFGRIGRQAFKIAHEKPEAEIVVINDLMEPSVIAYLLKYDTNYGRYHREVKHKEGAIIVDGKEFPVLAMKVEPKDLPWKKYAIDVVLECTGRFTEAEVAKGHLTAGARKVVISAPAKGEDATVVLSVNDQDIKKGPIISNASCTTNCITPVAQVVVSAFGVEKAMMTTMHGYTAEQNLVDGPPPGLHSGDLRRARAAAMNIVPTTTGATKATAKAIPELEGIFSGVAFRVPVSVGSVADFTFLVKRQTTVEEVNEVFRKAAKQDRFKGILEVTEDPIVSSDIVGTTASAIVDLPLTQVLGGNLVKVVAWYDNEWGYTNRLVEEAILVGRQK